MYAPQQPDPRQAHPQQPHRPRRRGRGRFMRFVRGYLMSVGALTTGYVLLQLLVRLFIEIAKWLPSQPNL